VRKYIIGAIGMACMVTLTAVDAQSTSSGTGTASSTTSAVQTAQSSNAGVTAQVYQYGATKMHETVNSQVPLSVVGYGSFSQNSCENAVGLGASTKVFSFIYNAPHPEQNCQHAVRSNEFGQESQLARAEAKPTQAENMRALSVWEACTADDDTIAACIRMGVIAYVDPSHPDIHQTKPNPYYGVPAVPQASVQSRPAATVTNGQAFADEQAVQGGSFWKNEPWAKGTTSR